MVANLQDQAASLRPRQQMKFRLEGLAPDDGLLLRFSYDEPTDESIYSFSYPATEGSQTKTEGSPNGDHFCTIQVPADPSAKEAVSKIQPRSVSDRQAQTCFSASTQDIDSSNGVQMGKGVPSSVPTVGDRHPPCTAVPMSEDAVRQSGLSSDLGAATGHGSASRGAQQPGVPVSSSTGIGEQLPSRKTEIGLGQEVDSARETAHEAAVKATHTHLQEAKDVGEEAAVRVPSSDRYFWVAGTRGRPSSLS
eukprot:jgi/Botrbrau1/4606/Bobra.60_2s0091.1